MQYCEQGEGGAPGHQVGGREGLKVGGAAPLVPVEPKLGEEPGGAAPLNPKKDNHFHSVIFKIITFALCHI